MAIANTTQLANAIREAYASGFVQGVFYNSEVLGAVNPVSGQKIFQEVDNPGDTAYKWKLNSAGNTSVESFSEGDGAPTAVAQTYVNATLAYTYLWAPVQITGHLRDALRSQWFDALDNEFMGAQLALSDLANTTVLNDTTVGLAGAIDEANTYAGIARGSAAYFESSVDDVSGSLTVAVLRDLHELVRDNDKGGKVMCWLAPHNQLTNIAALLGTEGASNAAQRTGMSPTEVRNIGFNVNTQYVMGAPVLPLSDMTDTNILAIDHRPGKFLFVRRRDLQVKELGASGDSDRFLLSMAFAAPVVDPRTQGKLENVTA